MDFGQEKLWVGNEFNLPRWESKDLLRSLRRNENVGHPSKRATALE
jgi:hypothetical protein